MWFKNLQVYRFPAPWDVDLPRLERELGQHAFRPTSGFELETRGWSAPTSSGALVHAVHGQLLICLTTEKKLLPASVIKDLLAVRAEEAESRQGYKPGKKQMRDLKEQVIDELLPRAFSVRRQVRAWIDPKNGWLAVDAGSPGRADDVVSLINKSVAGLVPEHLDLVQSAGASMTTWLAADDWPAGFTPDQDTELQSPLEEKATVRFVRHSLEPAEVKRHIDAGKQCTRLAMTWMNRVSFTLTENLAIKKLKPVDVIRKDEPESEDGDEKFDADFTMMTGELAALLADLANALGGFKDAARPAGRQKIPEALAAE